MRKVQVRRPPTDHVKILNRSRERDHPMRGGERAAVIAASILAVGALTVAGYWAWEQAHDHPHSNLRDLAGNAVTFDPGTLPSPHAEHEMHAVPELPGQRLVVPAVGLNVPLGAMDAVKGQIEPPTFTSAYWVRNLGASPTAPTGGTVFVAMHSLRGGGIGPGNYLYDTTTSIARVYPGDSITLGNVNYTVTATTTVPKRSIRADSAVWANTPNRLLLVTCLELPTGGPSLDNFIVTATRTT